MLESEGGVDCNPPLSRLPLSVFGGYLRELKRMNFARDLQERLGILALLALSAPFRICKFQILLAARETDPVSGHH